MIVVVQVKGIVIGAGKYTCTNAIMTADVGERMTFLVAIWT